MLGTFKADVKIVDNQTISVDGKPIKVVSSRDRLKLPWAEMGIDIVIEAVVVFLITVHAYANEKSEMEELSLVALSGCIWLQAFVVALEMNSFTMLQHLAIWGNFAGFYAINCIVSTIPTAGMYTIMFRLCRQPSYWITMMLIVVVGMGPIFALKYFRYTYRSSAINILQKAERSRSPIFSLGNIESQLKTVDKDMASLSAISSKNRNSAHEPLLIDSPTATRRSAQSRLSSSYSRNYKNN